MSKNRMSKSQIKKTLSRKDLARDLKTFRDSMKMGKSVMDEVRSEPRYEPPIKSA